MIVRYFERDADRDIDSIVNLFADDATVIDEGEERRGTDEIRAWQTGAASKYTYTTEGTNADALGPDRYVVTGRLTGNPRAAPPTSNGTPPSPASASRGSSSPRKGISRNRRRTSSPPR